MASKLIQKTLQLQREFSKLVITKNHLPKKIMSVCGVDVSYSEKKAFCSAVIIEKNTMDIVESVRVSETIIAPYIPGLFMLRESRVILKALKKLKSKFDVLLIDGNGRLHPRLCGLASFIGIKIDKPTIGVAKKLLCGKILQDNMIEYNDQVLGYVMEHQKKKIYVSIGHKINLKRGSQIVEDLILEEKWYPEPLRLADLDSKLFRKGMTQKFLN